MVAVVTTGIAGALGVPSFKTGERFLGAAGTAHVEDGGGAAHERSFGAGLVGVLEKRAHEGQVDVGVRINEAGKNVLARGVNHLGAGRRLDVLSIVGDGFSLAPDVGDIAGVSW